MPLDSTRFARSAAGVTALAGACACVDERLERVALEYLSEVVGGDRVER